MSPHCSSPAKTFSSSGSRLTELEIAVVVTNAVLEVDLAMPEVARTVGKKSAEDSRGPIILYGNADIPSRFGEASTAPGKFALGRVNN